MIRRIKVENYKSLKSIDVSLYDMTVVFGPNAAGKSNLFDALNLVARLVTHKNIKEAFEEHRGLPLESIFYSHGRLIDVLKQKNHKMRFEVDVELSDPVVRYVEQRIRELRKGIDDEKNGTTNRVRVTESYLRYVVELEILSESGIIRIVDERLAALKNDGSREKAKNAFLEKNGNRLSLRMEGQAHPTYHEIGLDYTLASTSLYAPHYPHLTAFREEMSRCRFYYFEPRQLMREATAVADVTVLGSRGEDMAAFYHTLSIKHPNMFRALKLAAKRLVPRLTDITIDRNEKAELFLNVTMDDASYSNRLISEGTLRVLGLLAVLSPVSGSTTIGYEEPENGVHPRRLKEIADLFENAASPNQQIVVNTHSPVLPSYFRNKNLIVCRVGENGTEFIPFTSMGPLFKPNEIAKHLEERILRGDYGG